MIVLYVVYLLETVGERKYKEGIEWVLNKGCWYRGSRSLDHVVFIRARRPTSHVERLIQYYFAHL